jgi:hypothetical protein
VQVEPYLRAHLFDGFGCAALFALVFRHINQVPEGPQGSWLDRFLKSLSDKRYWWAASGLTAASVVIAAASVFVAGGGIWDVLWAGLLSGVILAGFWSGVAVGVALPEEDETEAEAAPG